MAVQEVRVYIDDLTGKRIKDGHVHTITFSVDNKREHLMHLNGKNAEEFYNFIEPYKKASRQVKDSENSDMKRSGTARTETLSQNQIIREWAKSEGYDLMSRGRIPVNVVTAYKAAHPT